MSPGAIYLFFVLIVLAHNLNMKAVRSDPFNNLPNADLNFGLNAISFLQRHSSIVVKATVKERT